MSDQKGAARTLPITEEQRAEAERQATKERLDKLRQAATERAQKDADLAEARELEALELTEKLRAELGGEPGEAFLVIRNRFGVFAIKRPDTRAIRNWEQATDKQRLSLEWQIGILRHYIMPAERQIAWAQLCGERPGLCWQTADAFVDLMGIDREGLEKKR